MAAIVITPDVLKAAKKQLALWYPQASSSAVTEALARGLGYRTNAALRAAIQAPSKELEKIRLFEPAPFVERLRELSDGAAPVHDEEQLIDLDASLGEVSVDGIFPTRKRERAQDETLTRPLDLAWQRIMVAAANAGIRKGLFTMRAGAGPKSQESDMLEFLLDAFRFGPQSIWYEFEIEGQPARCRIGVITPEEELRLDVIVWPSEHAFDEGERDVFGVARYENLGDVVTVGWFERSQGAWLQAGTMFTCRNPERLLTVQSFRMERPLGFAPLGLANL